MADGDEKANETRVRREAQARDGAAAKAAYEAEAIAVRARTEKLRAMRLAREAQERAAEPAATAKPAGKRSTARGAAAPKSKAKGKVKTERLSDWLEGQGKEGRRS